MVAGDLSAGSVVTAAVPTPKHGGTAVGRGAGKKVGGSGQAGATSGGDSASRGLLRNARGRVATLGSEAGRKRYTYTFSAGLQQ